MKQKSEKSSQKNSSLLKRTFLPFLSVLILLYLPACDIVEDDIVEKDTVVNDMAGKLTLPIKGAENSFMTAEGRLFISGSENFYEITRDDKGNYQSSALHETGGNFMGITRHGKFLFVIRIKVKESIDLFGCDHFALFSDPSYTILDCLRDKIAETEELLYARLFDENGRRVEKPVLKHLYTFNDMFMPNGMTADSKGRIYIADETMLPSGQVVRLTLSFNDNPRVTGYEQFLINTTMESGKLSPNGMTVIDDTLYFTNFLLPSLSNFWTHQLVSVPLMKGGTDCEAVPQVVYERQGFTFFDDITIGDVNGKSYIVVTDYFKGTLLFINRNSGELVHETPDQTFETPTSPVFGREPLISSDILIVTQTSADRVESIEIPDI